MNELEKELKEFETYLNKNRKKGLNLPIETVTDYISDDITDNVKKFNFLNTNVYVGLENLNDGFDAKSIFYFSESDFEIVLDRVEKLGIGIMGIEPWLDGEYYDVRVFGEFNTTPFDPRWYRKVFDDYKKKEENLQYAASYKIPK